MIEYKDKGYVFFEVKYNGKDLPYGQRLALERLVNDVDKTGKSAIAIVINHEVHDINKSVDVAACKVRELYYSREKRWRPPNHSITTKNLVDGFLSII